MATTTLTGRERTADAAACPSGSVDVPGGPVARGADATPAAPSVPVLRPGAGAPGGAPRPATWRIPALLALGLHVVAGTVGTMLWVAGTAPEAPPVASLAVFAPPQPAPPEPPPEDPPVLPPTEARFDPVEPLLDAEPLPVETSPVASRFEGAPSFEPSAPPSFDGPRRVVPRRRPSPETAAAPAPAQVTAELRRVPSGPTRGVALLEGGCPDPAYPRRERDRGIEGTTRLRFLVDVDGTVEQVEVHTSSGVEALDDAALEAALHWRFLPALEDGIAVASWALRDVRFVLAH